MIKNINYEDYNDYTACKKINEIIDFLNDKFDFGDDEYQSTRQRHNIIDYMHADMKESKSWQKKLEEAELTSLPYYENGMITNRMCDYKKAMNKIDLFRHVIEELIKDNEELKKINKYGLNKYLKLEKQLQQKQPDKESLNKIMNHLKKLDKRHNTICDFSLCSDGSGSISFDGRDEKIFIFRFDNLKELLKYFKEINDSN